MKFKTLFYLCIITGCFLFILLLNPFSNIHFAFSNNGELIFNPSENIETVHESEEVLIQEISYTRKGSGKSQSLLNMISPTELYFIKFKKNQNNFSLSYDKEGSTARDLVNGNTLFAINSSFYDKEGQSVGEVVIDGVKYGTKTTSSGFFKVINGKAIVGPRSIFSYRFGKVQYACQAHPSVMKNGMIWNYIQEESLYKDSFSRKTYRNLCGMDKEKNICFVVSGNGGLISVKEITEIAKKLGVRTASLFDAGSALQYRFQDKHYTLNFSAYNNLLNLGSGVNNFFIKHTGRTFYNESPVFMMYKTLTSEKE